MIKQSLPEYIINLLKLKMGAVFSPHKFINAPKIEQAQWLYKLVYESRFELLSHFIFGPFSGFIKTGEEFLFGLQYGCGGVCVEKVSGLKLLLETFDVGECTIVMGGSLPGANQPIDIAKVYTSLDNKGRKQHSIFAHHAALLLTINGKEWLLDPNHGRLGKIFLNPAMTASLLETNPAHKFGIEASFGQMFYHRVPSELFTAMVDANRGDEFLALDLICNMGIIVGENYDIFAIPQTMIEEQMERIFPRRVPVSCWEIDSKNVSQSLPLYNLKWEKHPNDQFSELVDQGIAKIFSISQQPQGKGELQLVLRIATQPWSDFTRVAPPIAAEFLMR